MKRITLSYHRDFPRTPISWWSGARKQAYQVVQAANGQWKKPRLVDHPFPTSLKLWCLMEIEFQGVRLLFATSRELDQFMDVMGQNPLPSGRSLCPEQAIGRPNSHWLSRLPSKTRTWKYRKALLSYLNGAREVAIFRDFYQRTPPQYDGPADYMSHFDAYCRYRMLLAQPRKLKQTRTPS